MFEMVFYGGGLGKYLLCKMYITFTLRVLWGYGREANVSR